MSGALAGERVKVLRTLDARAREILRANDRGAYTVPSARMYPHQWNWDSAFAALGFATIDVDRAWVELETLFEAQWPSGMVPHIVYRHDDPDYFPGRGEWGVEHEPPSSGFSQPPVAASVALDLYRRDEEVGGARLRTLFPRLVSWHRWFHTARDRGDGLIAVAHPWESGRDNSPDWDEAMSGVETGNLPSYERRDTLHVSADMRPTERDYDRYLEIIAHGRRCGWNDDAIRDTSPFRVIDPSITFILMRADRDLARIARILGEEALAAEFERYATSSGSAVASLWCDSAGAYLARNERSGARASAVGIGAFLAFWAGVGDGRLARRLERMLELVPYGLPSADPGSAIFDATRYWRGPAWPITNYLVGRGLAESGRRALARRLREDLAHLIEGAGFCECFNPVNGTGSGGENFTWTAAIWLHWASPTARRVT